MPDRSPRPRRDEQVRALLADAGVDDGVPPEVAERLDAVLGQLERGEAVPGPPDPDDVVRLADVRRRRVTRVLAGAAAAVVLGVAAGNGIQALRDGAGSASTAASDSSAADREAGAGSRRSSQADAGASALDSSAASVQGGASARKSASSSVLALDDALTVISSDAFADDALGARKRLRAGDGAEATSAHLGSLWQACAPADWGEGRLLAVEYEGDAAVLAFRPSTGDTQVVDLLQCGSADVLRSATLSSD
ncbi:hypothetical protein [Nocardioides sp. GY 10127]|uniref:hypothetical protein n=1 Tax=Nocardioides sp. GY 10127 TaxID=2569762 RepID=UPI001458AE84|nr:hypothetical protein [Nocardioides sp. GY 10127]